MKYRCVTCSMKCIATIYLAPLCVPIYACLAGGCRKEEADSFEMILTNQNIHFRQMIYQYGICCQASGTKTIPLEKIQDISLVSDWLGDSCGVVDRAGEEYQIHVQTAAMGGMLPELCVYCIENPREFKQQVFAAKRALTATAGAGTAPTQQELARVVGLLDRQAPHPYVVASAPKGF